jgi:hypothetical protein
MIRFKQGCLSVLLLLSSKVLAIAERNVSFDMGFGVPQLIYAQTQANVSHHWQVGFGYGILPGFSTLASQVSIPTITVNMGVAGDFDIQPTMAAALSAWSPFVRYYPTDSNFYIQLSLLFWKVSADLTGALTQAATGIYGGNVTGAVAIYQTVPTLGVGHVFAGKEYFINVLLGFSYFGPSLTSVSVVSGIPAALGGAALQSTVESTVSDALSTAANQATDQIRTQFPVLPSLSISMGIFL